MKKSYLMFIICLTTAFCACTESAKKVDAEPDGLPENTEARCSDGIDNDSD